MVWKSKKGFDHISWSHMGLQLWNHLIFVLFTFLTLRFVAMVDMSRVSGSCGTVSPLGHFLHTMFNLSPEVIYRKYEMCELWGMMT